MVSPQKKPALLLLASVSIGISPECARVAHRASWASTGTNGQGSTTTAQGQNGFGNHTVEHSRQRLTFLLVTLQAYRSIRKNTKWTGLYIKIKSEARHFKLQVKQRTVPFSAPQVFHNFRSNIFNLFLLCRQQLESTLLYYQMYCN